MNLYFIAGASGSGKTAIIPHLKELWGQRIAVYDFDEIGVPKDADTKWRQEFTEKWLQKLLSDNQDACLLGQIFACPSATQLSKINFCFLDVSDIERIKRLRKRGTYGADQNMLSWACMASYASFRSALASTGHKREFLERFKLECFR